MAGMFFNVLRAWHPMIGRDFHLPWPPGAPAALPTPAPYMTMSLMYGTGLTSKYTPTVFADAINPVMAKLTDIGPMIPHVGPPSMTLILEILTSGSKSYFGPMQYVTKDQTGATANPAVALMFSVNPNLNCGTPMPTPFGMVMAITTHVLGMTVGDIAGGVFNMLWDAAIQTALFRVFDSKLAGKLFGALATRIGARLGPKLLGRTAARQLARAMGQRANIGPMQRALQAARRAELAKFVQVTGQRIPVVVGQAVGSPLGPSVSNYGPKSGYDRAMAPLTGDDISLGDAFGREVDSYFNSPAAEDINPAPSNPAGMDAGAADAGESSTGGVPNASDPVDRGAGGAQPDVSSSSPVGADAGTGTPGDLDAGSTESGASAPANSSTPPSSGASEGPVCDPDDPSQENLP